MRIQIFCYQYEQIEGMREYMVARPTARETTKGICSFCKGEFDKEDMARHLKQCEQRTNIANEVKGSTNQKIKFFHLEVEGRYNPQYWMHLEVPVSEPLETLDDFLRDIWVECCEHLSSFNIEGTSYSSEEEDFYFDMPEAVGDQQIEEVEEEKEEDGSVNVIDLDAIIEFIPSPHKEMLASTLLPELRNEWPTDNLVAFLRGKLQAIPKRRKRGTPVEQDNYWERYYQKWLLEYLLALVEDRSLNATLGNVLRVGQKFSYLYDFGSTTYLNLRVVASRQGVVRDEEQSVKLLARNEPPVIVCQTCGKPATQVISGYYNVEENGYCDECVRKLKRDGFEMLLPVVNSPRIGVCGYTGNQDYELDWDELDDEELEEEE